MDKGDKDKQAEPLSAGSKETPHSTQANAPATDDEWVDLHDGWEPVRKRRNSDPGNIG